ncbi:MAG: extensin family protein [Rhodopseudomonas palustris]|nr:MAG: extensin family protein [Rhodopseudomonas palustris]
MMRGVRLFLVGSIALVSLAGCGRGLFQFAEREPWRAEAEVACLKSGAVKMSADVVQIDPISGPGVCGADYPLKVAALGEVGAVGFADELRPPGQVGAAQPRWPINQQPSYQPAAAPAGSGYGSRSGPVPLNAPGSSADDETELGPDGLGAAPSGRSDPRGSAYGGGHDSAPPRLGSGMGNVTGAVGPVAIKPVATLACPIVSTLDKWLVEQVQPAALRWFGARVVEIKQISAYSCRGMNGNSRSRISEHAFGNAFDIAGFTFADGRRITVRDGWKGLPEEQGFLRDVHASACEYFSTVLSPGSNIYHYDHIHVDLMRRSSGRQVCKPVAVSGEAIAGRLQRHNAFAAVPSYTSGLGGHRRGGSRSSHGDEDDYNNE